MSASSTRSRRKSRAAALFGSVALHILLFTAMVVTLRLPVQPVDSPSMQVEIYSSLFDLRQPKPRTRPDSERTQIIPPTTAPTPAPAREALRPEGPTNRYQFNPPTAGRPLAAVTPFFRNHIRDCGKEDLALMEPAERERCQVRITAQDVLDNGNMKASDRLATPILRLDPERRAEFDREIGRRRGRAAQNDPIKACDGPTVGLGSACLNHDKPPE